MVGGQNSIFQYCQHKYKRWICNIMASQKWKSKFPYHIFNIKDPRYDISKPRKTKQNYNVCYYFPPIIIGFKHEIVILLYRKIFTDILVAIIQILSLEVAESWSLPDKTKDVCWRQKFGNWRQKSIAQSKYYLNANSNLKW